MKVLIAEDDGVSRRLLRGHLEKWGHEVVESVDGAEAWRLMEAGEFPLVVADWMMPGTDGVELVRRIRARQSRSYVYIILLTAKTQKDDIVHGMEAGADDYVTKPFDREELRVRINAGVRIINLERDLLAAQARLINQEKLASIGQIAMGVAHEIGAPLTGLSDHLHRVRKDALGLAAIADAGAAGDAQELAAATTEVGDVATSRQRLVTALNSANDTLKRVTDVVRSLRDFARIDDLITRPVSLKEVVADTIGMILREMEKKNVRLDSDVAEMPTVTGNPGKLKKLVFSLLTNAVSSVDRGGTVSLKARQSEGRAEITIGDTGPAISPGDLPRVFEPFFEVRGRPGRGLALSIAQSIAAEHGGRVTATSANAGAVFTLSLPVR